MRESLLRGALRIIKRLDWRDTSAAAFDPAGVSSILLISSTALGDTVISTAAMNAVRARYPDARIVALIHRAYVKLFRNHPALDDVVTYRGGYRGFFGLVRILRWYRFDLALILHGNEPQATPLAYLSGARFIFKLPNANNFRFLLANAEPIVGRAVFRHGMEHRLATARLAGALTDGARMSLPRMPAMERYVAEWLGKGGATPGGAMPRIGFQSGASSRARMWPEEYFADLARRVSLRHPGAVFVLLGSPDEAERCRHIAGLIGASARVAAGTLPIEALPSLVAALDLVVSGDTGTLHVAVAMDVPTVGLFAVSDPAVSGAAYDPERHTAIHRPYERKVTTKSQDQEGMCRIDVDTVERVVLARLAAGAGA
ncbi:MAG: glycosyltransferase family 9 protein [Rhodocyclaceae bacterium]|nr:glycosyltransferase family 9 protein [Rhodocyclaceae bacterium]